MTNITSTMNQSLLANSFGSRVLSSASQSSLLQSYVSQQIPDVNVDFGGQTQPLSGAVAQALSSQESTLSSLAQLNSYSAADSLLSAAYGVGSQGLSGLLTSSYGASGGVLSQAYLSNSDAVDQYA
ncbi:MAG: hypothetical protein CMF60_07050 [Magnetococcales bacterium]|nr:hypothetical protein [Magnetococcales bacterium]|tara:strand:+ start:13663 stop:14040 length:378 start_codon:yes stop_codon:yes gene_type:complete